MQTNAQREWYLHNTEAVLARTKAYYQKHRASALAQMKRYRNVPENKARMAAYQKAHRCERNERARRRYKTDLAFAARRRAYAKTYYQTHRTKRIAYTKEYLKVPAHLATLRKAQRTWRRENPLADRMRCRIKMALRRAAVDGRKQKRTIEYLGCSWAEYKEYLISRFQKGMTWAAYVAGKIHIDHIRPLVSFDLSDEAQLMIALHWTNTQPLWASDNHKKGGRYLR